MDVTAGEMKGAFLCMLLMIRAYGEDVSAIVALYALLRGVGVGNLPPLELFVNPLPLRTVGVGYPEGYDLGKRMRDVYAGCKLLEDHLLRMFGRPGLLIWLSFMKDHMEIDVEVRGLRGETYYDFSRRWTFRDYEREMNVGDLYWKN